MGERSSLNRIPESRVNVAPVAGFSVVEWEDTPEPTGRPVAVAILFDSPLFTKAVEILQETGALPAGVRPELMIRLKSAEVCDELIDALIFHRNNVWPGEPRKR